MQARASAWGFCRVVTLGTSTTLRQNSDNCADVCVFVLISDSSYVLVLSVSLQEESKMCQIWFQIMYIIDLI